jgi:hypothetical protein
MNKTSLSFLQNPVSAQITQQDDLSKFWIHKKVTYLTYSYLAYSYGRTYPANS